MCSQYVNAGSHTVCSSEAPFSLLSPSWVALFPFRDSSSVYNECFSGRFYPYSHVHEGADAATSDFPTFAFSSVLLCGGEAVRASNSTAQSLEKRGHNRVRGKRKCAYI